MFFWPVFCVLCSLFCASVFSVLCSLRRAHIFLFRSVSVYAPLETYYMSKPVQICPNCDTTQLNPKISVAPIACSMIGNLTNFCSISRFRQNLQKMQRWLILSGWGPTCALHTSLVCTSFGGIWHQFWQCLCLCYV